MATFNDLMRGGSRWDLRTFKGGGDTTSTQYTSQLPEYAEPYYTDLMAKSEAVSQEAYQPYDFQRIAAFDPSQQAAFQGSADLYNYGNPALGAATTGALAGTGTAWDIVNDPNTLSSTYAGAQNYNPMGFSASDLQNLTIDPSSMYLNAGQFDANTRDQYMSPYQEAVTENTISRAVSDAQQAQKFRDTAAVQAGAFGGDRRFIQDQMAERELLDRVSDIRASGTQSAFENAQQQYERDRAAGLQAGSTNLGSMIQAGGLNQDAVLQALGLGETSRQFGAGLTEEGQQFGSGLDAQLGQFNNQYMLDALSSMYGGSELLGNLGMSGQTAEMDRINQLYDMGAIQQGQTQQSYDQAYQDFINQRDYEKNALTWLSGILHGVPVSAESNVIQYQPSPNVAGQAIGSGIAGLGLYNSLQG